MEWTNVDGIWHPSRTEDWLCPEYRDDVHTNSGKGEWTSTWAYQPYKNNTTGKVIVRPKEVFFVEGEGGKEYEFEFPPNGWVLEYEPETGMPMITGTKEEAQERFGPDASYFYIETGFRNVFCNYNLGGLGPFVVDTGCSPNKGYSNIGGRPFCDSVE